jgi:DNA-binding transcriptional ArsR family regulator
VEGDGAVEPRYPPREELELVDVLHALSDPVRLQILGILDQADGAVSCGQIPLPVGKSTGSHHFRVLREAGVVTCRDQGTRRYYTLRRDDLDARFPGLLDTILRAVDSEPSGARSAGAAGE